MSELDQQGSRGYRGERHTCVVVMVLGLSVVNVIVVVKVLPSIVLVIVIMT